MKRINIEHADNASPYQKLVEQHGSPLLLLDCEKLNEQYRKLRRELPDVDLYYAIKSLPHPAVIRTLDALGAGFDIASSGEIELLREQHTRPRNTIHTHPIKRDSDIRDALRFGCTTFVIDNIWELEKFVGYRHRVGLLIRVSFPNPNSPVDLSRKFGCRPNEVELLLQKASTMGIRVKGLSFHAGSQCPDSRNHVHAIEQCKAIIEQWHANSGKLLSILDIGGGFPVQYHQAVSDIASFCQPMRAALIELPPYVRVIAEPGRYLSAPAVTSIASVMGKAHRGDSVWYYLDDGLYGSFSGQLYDHAVYPLTVFSEIEQRECAVLAGPTCDSIDVIAEDLHIPPMNIGDLLIGKQMGAYTSASATDFNLFKRAQVVVINDHPAADADTTVVPFG
jgi:ornithine decarboxylase